MRTNQSRSHRSPPPWRPVVTTVLVSSLVDSFEPRCCSRSKARRRTGRRSPGRRRATNVDRLDLTHARHPAPGRAWPGALLQGSPMTCTPLTPLRTLCHIFTRVQAGEGRCVGILALQAFTLMVAYYLIRPVREALILTEGTAELRSYAVGVQAVLLDPDPARLRRAGPARATRTASSGSSWHSSRSTWWLFCLIGHAGLRFSFVFFVWASIFGVMAVTQFWAFATDLLDVKSGTRLFGVIAVGVSAGALAGAQPGLSRASTRSGPTA